MTGQEIGELLEKQRAFYKSGATVPVAFRREQLKKLYAAVKKYQKEIEDALKADLGKSPYEGFMCENLQREKGCTPLWHSFLPTASGNRCPMGMC